MTNTPTENSKKWIVPFVAAVVGMMSLQMSSLGFSPLLPSIKKDFDLNFSQMGLFTGLYGILAMLLSVPAGLMAKRFGEKKILIAGIIIIAIGLVMLSCSTNFTEALIARGVWIGGYRFAFVCILTAIALTAPPSLKGRTMGIVGAMSSFASVIGAPFGSTLGQTYGWRQGIFGFAVIAVLGAIIVSIFYKRQSNDGLVSAHKIDTAANTTGKSAFQMPIIWALALFMGLVGTISFSITFFMPSAGESVFKMDKVAASLVISSGYFLAIFVNLFVGWLMDKYNRWVVIGTLMSLMIPACFGLTIDNEMIFKVSAACAIALGFTATNQCYGIAGTVLNGREVGNVIGMISFGAGVFAFLGPQMLGALRDLTQNFNAGWYMMMGVAVFTIFEIYFLKKYSEKDI